MCSSHLSTTLYKEALLTVGNVLPWVGAKQITATNEDPRLAQDLDRKSHQLLVEIGKDAVEGKRVVEIEERMENPLNNMDPTPPEGAKIQEINKLRNGGVIIQFVSRFPVKACLLNSSQSQSTASNCRG